MAKKKKRKSKFRFLLRFLLKLAVIAGAGYAVFTYVLCLYRQPGNNMFPAIHEGDLCIFYRLEESYLGDVVLYENQEGKEIIGRIVATGGQTVDFPEEGGYLVNNYQPTEEITYETHAAESSDVAFPLQLADDEVFIMNDFRQDTNDGRESGAVKKSKIRGKAIFILRRRGF